MEQILFLKGPLSGNDTESAQRSHGLFVFFFFFFFIPRKTGCETINNAFCLLHQLFRDFSNRKILHFGLTGLSTCIKITSIF